MGKSRFQKKGKKAVQVLVTWGPSCGTIYRPTLGKQPLEEFSKLKSKTGYGRKSPVCKSENPKNHFVVPIVTRGSPRKATKLWCLASQIQNMAVTLHEKILWLELVFDI